MTIFFTAQLILLPFVLWLLFLVLVGLLPARKRTGHGEKELRFAIICCARNEERVIAKLLRSLEEQDYPKDCRSLFVIAHNCTDRTAEVAGESSATVWELNQPDKRCKGDALQYGIARILSEYPDQFDAFCVFDADNTAAPSFLRVMSYELQQPGVDGTIGMRMANNPHESFVAEMLAVHWLVMSRMYHLPRMRLGLSCVIQGTGFCVKLDCVIPHGWQTSALTEDFEFTVRKVLTGRRFIHVPNALFYDEQPAQLGTWIHQMYRWMFGAKQCTRFIPTILFGLFRSPIRGLDLLWNTCMVPVFALTALTTGVALILAWSTGDHELTFMAKSAGCGLLAAIGLVLFMAGTSTLLCGLRLRDFFRGVVSYPLFTMSGPFLFLLTLPRRRCTWRSVLHKGGIETSGEPTAEQSSQTKL